MQVQVLGYNGQLYSSESSSLKSPNGGVGIAVLVQVGEKTNPELENIIKAASTLKYAGSSTTLSSVSLSSLVPTTSQMITYEGSLTQPGCQVAPDTNSQAGCCYLAGVCYLDHPQQAYLRAGRAHVAAD